MAIVGGYARYKPFYNHDGSLSQYALACGYVQRDIRGRWEYVLWKEHGTYHVAVYDRASSSPRSFIDAAYREAFDSLTKARKWRVDAREL
jgi:hypothetical protein